jgi:ATP-dependent Lhr-like helicase
MDEPSRALLAPGNRFEVLECRAAVEAVTAGELDGQHLKAGSLDVLAQHVMAHACGDGFNSETLFEEVRQALPYENLSLKTWRRVVDLVATGGYALGGYERFRRIVQSHDGLWRARNEEVRRRHRMNAGTIIEEPMVSVRYASFVKTSGTRTLTRAGRRLGQMEEAFFEVLAPGDTFIFAGEVLRFEGLQGLEALVTRSSDGQPKIPAYTGGKFPLTTSLAARVRAMLQDRAGWSALPPQVREWIEVQEKRSAIPRVGQLLVETFPRNGRHFLVCYPFEGRLAHQTLGMLLTRRIERARLKPVGFVASDYALAVWAAEDLRTMDMHQLFHEDMLGDDLDAWLAESSLMKRTFRNNALIAGLIERRLPRATRTGRQVTFSTDLIYDVLRSHEPDHILLEAARQDAGEGLLDIRRLSDALKRIRGHVLHMKLDRITPFAVPVILEIGRETVFSGEAAEAILRESENSIAHEAMS